MTFEPLTHYHVVSSLACHKATIHIGIDSTNLSTRVETDCTKCSSSGHVKRKYSGMGLLKL